MLEKEIIQLIKSSLPPEASSLIGDDCAFLQEKNLLVSTDTLVEGVHFLAKTAPYDLGWKVAAVNLSDIAAMGGIPEFLTLTASLPPGCDSAWIGNFLSGLTECCQQYHTLLIGGDLTASPQIFLSATILGRPSEGKVARRSNARPGQKIGISGFLGSSAAGLWALQHDHHFSPLLAKHLRPIPQIKAGQSLLKHNAGPVALMDSSDGLLDCLKQISDQSQVSLLLDLAQTPYSPDLPALAKLAGKDFREWLLVGGEDYALIGMAESFPDDWVVIGSVQEGEGLEISWKGLSFNWQTFKLFEHFC